MSRQSPEQHASETRVGTVMPGIDGHQWIVKEMPNLTRRWVRHDSGKVYYIWDNGGLPFMVKVGKDEIEVWKINFERSHEDQENNPGEVRIYDKMVKAFTDFEKVFIGKSTDPNYKDDFEGNSILIKINAHKYIFIGWKILSFTTKDEIHTYVSDMGNSGVPYPYAIGTENTYFLIEDVYIPNDLMDDVFSNDKKSMFGDPYQFLYHDKKLRKYYEEKFPIKKKILVERVW